MLIHLLLWFLRRTEISTDFRNSNFKASELSQINKSIVYFTIRRNLKFFCSEYLSAYYVRREIKPNAVFPNIYLSMGIDNVQMEVSQITNVIAPGPGCSKLTTSLVNEPLKF